MGPEITRDVCDIYRKEGKVFISVSGGRVQVKGTDMAKVLECGYACCVPSR